MLGATAIVCTVAGSRWRPSRGSRLRRVARSRLAANTLAMAAGTGGRLLLQIALFVIVARLLGPADYGAFISITATVAIISTFAGLACEAVVVKNTARDRTSFAPAFGHGLILLTATAPPLAAMALIAIELMGLSTIRPILVLAIAIGDLLFLRVSLFCAACYQAHEKVGRAALLNIGFSAARLVAAALAAASASPLTIENWAAFYAGSAALAALVSMAMVIRDLGGPRWNLLTGELRFGLHASAQSTLYFTLRDIDKPLLAKLSGLDAAGLYAAAFRVADAAIVPIRSLMYAAYASFFRHGADGAGRGMQFGLRLLPYAVAYGVTAGIGLLLVPYLLPWILGHDYAAAGAILLPLAALPLLHAAYNIGADALTASGLQASRSLVHIAGAVVMVAACLLLIPRFGVIGAGLANLLGHAALAALTWICLLRHRTRAGSSVPARSVLSKGDPA